MWVKTKLKPGKLGKITVLKDINVGKILSKTARILLIQGRLKKVENIEYITIRKNMGTILFRAGEWVTKMPSHILYETQSKARLAKLNDKYRYSLLIYLSGAFYIYLPK